MNPVSVVTLVERSFKRAAAEPSIQRWKSMSEFAGTAAVAYANNNETFLAAAMEGVAEYAKRQQLAMQPKAVA